MQSSLLFLSFSNMDCAFQAIVERGDRNREYPVFNHQVLMFEYIFLIFVCFRSRSWEWFFCVDMRCDLRMGRTKQCLENFQSSRPTILKARCCRHLPSIAIRTFDTRSRYISESVHTIPTSAFCYYRCYFLREGREEIEGL